MLNIVISIFGSLIGLAAIIYLFPKIIFRNTTWMNQAREQIKSKAKTLEALPISDLRKLENNEQIENIKIENIPITITTWAKHHSDNHLGIVVEARRYGPLGISQVITEGFFKKDSGDISQMQEYDFWEYGY